MGKAKPLDLDALAAEQDREPFRFVFGGEEYEIAAEVDILVGSLLKQRRNDDAMRRLLGDEQWERMHRSPAVLTMEKAQALVEGWLVHCGATMGESAASAG